MLPILLCFTNATWYWATVPPKPEKPGMWTLGGPRGSTATSSVAQGKVLLFLHGSWAQVHMGCPQMGEALLDSSDTQFCAVQRSLQAVACGPSLT